MDSSKFLIVGANGQLGTALREKYPDARAVDSDELDITDGEKVTNFDWAPYTTILNAAAYTNVDGAETPDGRRLAWLVNATGVRNLVAVARKQDLTLVHISTDYVFDGALVNHTEDEPLTPLSVYGQSKAAADVLVGLVPKHYILRSTWIIGNGKNFVRTMLGLGASGMSPTVVSDQIGRLTFADELVNIIDYLLVKQAKYGVYNATNEGEPASWADVTRLTFKLANYDVAVTNTTTAEYFAEKEGVALRPLNSIMDLRKIESSGYTPRDWHLALADYIKKEQSK